MNLVVISLEDLRHVVKQAVAEALSSVQLEAPKPPEADLLSARDVCKLLNISLTTLWVYQKQQRLPAPHKIGRNRLWPKAQLMEAVTRLKR